MDANDANATTPPILLSIGSVGGVGVSVALGPVGAPLGLTRWGGLLGALWPPSPSLSGAGPLRRRRRFGRPLGALWRLLYMALWGSCFAPLRVVCLLWGVLGVCGGKYALFAGKKFGFQRTPTPTTRPRRNHAPKCPEKLQIPPVLAAFATLCVGRDCAYACNLRRIGVFWASVHIWEV